MGCSVIVFSKIIFALSAGNFFRHFNRMWSCPQIYPRILPQCNYVQQTQNPRILQCLFRQSFGPKFNHHPYHSVLLLLVPVVNNLVQLVNVNFRENHFDKNDQGLSFPIRCVTKVVFLRQHNDFIWAATLRIDRGQMSSLFYSLYFLD